MQNDATSGLKEIVEGLTEPAGLASMSFSMLLLTAQQVVTTAQSVGTPGRGQEKAGVRAGMRRSTPGSEEKKDQGGGEDEEDWTHLGG